MAYKKKNGQTGFIYTLSEPIPDHDPNAEFWMVRYVGQTLSPDERYSWRNIKLHIDEIRMIDTKRDVDRWVKELIQKGIEPRMHIHDEVPDDKQSMDDAEGEWVSIWEKKVSKPLLNADDAKGSHGRPNKRTRKKMSDAQKLRTIDGKRTPSKKRTKIMAEKALNSEHEAEEQSFHNANKPIIQCDQNKNEICEWQSINIAARELGLPQQNIRRSCKASAIEGARPSFCGGCIWKWKYPENQAKDFMGNPIVQHDLEKNLIKEWKSLSQIEKETDFLRQPISSACKANRDKLKNRENHSCYGFIWEYKYPELRSKRNHKPIEHKKVAQFDEQENLIKVWDNPTIIERENKGFSKVAITQCCNANQKKPYKNYTHHGFIWLWAAELDTMNQSPKYDVYNKDMLYDKTNEKFAHIKMEDLNSRPGKAVLQFDPYNNFLKKWEKIGHLEGEFGYKRNAIRDCCNGNENLKKSLQRYGSIWRWAPETEEETQQLIEQVKNNIVEKIKDYTKINKSGNKIITGLVKETVKMMKKSSIGDVLIFFHQKIMNITTQFPEVNDMDIRTKIARDLQNGWHTFNRKDPDRKLHKIQFSAHNEPLWGNEHKYIIPQDEEGQKKFFLKTEEIINELLSDEEERYDRTVLLNN